jgi:hypothetical protein
VHDTDGCLSDSDPTPATTDCHHAKINDEPPSLPLVNFILNGL